MRKLAILLGIFALFALVALPLTAQDVTVEPSDIATEAATMAAEEAMTDDNMGMAEATAEATAAAPDVQTAHIRVAHLSPDTPPVQIYINGELSDIQTITYPDITGWVEVPVGTYDIAVVPIDQSLENAAIGPIQLSFTANAWVTIAALGSFENGTLNAEIIPENYSRIPLQTSRLTVVHAIEGGPAVDVRVGEQIPVSELFYTGAVTVDVPAGTYDVAVVPTGQTEPAVVALPNTTFEPGTFYFVAVIGSADEPTVLVSEVTTEQISTFQTNAVGSIVDVAAADGRFTTLLSAIEAAGLTETLSGEGPFTVFAPVDAAFAALPEGALDSLLADPQALENLLLYHVHDGVLTGEDLRDMTTVTTLAGSDLTLTFTAEGVFLNDTAQIIILDIPTSNGVIHAINDVLMPPADMAASDAGADMMATEEAMSDPMMAEPTEAVGS